VPASQVISAPDITSIYDVPINFEKDNISDTILTLLKIKARSRGVNLAPWKRFVVRRQKAVAPVKIAIIGKYVDIGDYNLADSYISINQALQHASANLNVGVEISWVDSKLFENRNNKLSELKRYDGA